jgi:prepilin-type N-terminal cleavage/methylation domain-containing protein
MPFQLPVASCQLGFDRMFRESRLRQMCGGRHPEPQAEDLPACSNLSAFGKGWDPSPAAQDDGMVDHCERPKGARQSSTLTALPLVLQGHVPSRHPSESWDPEEAERLDSNFRWNDEVGRIGRQRRLAMTASPGFTLVELSIVLVIIGLILGGVMVGRSMIRSSQVNSIATDAEAYSTAAQLFIDKYQGLPGDITNATTFWSSTIVANGNGNGILDVAGAVSAPGEVYGAWEQMALAGLIKGKYTGTSGSGSTYHSIIGTNVPAARLSATGFSWGTIQSTSGSGWFYDGAYGSNLSFGGPCTNDVTCAAALTPSEAYQLDLKVDDGVPGTGIVRTYHSTPRPNCATGTAANAATSTYVTSYSGLACMLIYTAGF